jgi:hypothetical protein
MSKQVVAVSAIVAALTSLATSSFWASAASNRQGVHVIYKIVTGINYTGRGGKPITVEPGDVGTEESACPDGWKLISGGYAMSGQVGEAIPVVTRNVPNFGSWKIGVAVPKLGLPVSAAAFADCIQLVYKTISVTP